VGHFAAASGWRGKTELLIDEIDERATGKITPEILAN
jgi:hypothetical protein